MYKKRVDFSTLTTDITLGNSFENNSLILIPNLANTQYSMT